MSAIEAGIITDSVKARLVELEERCAALRQGIAVAEIEPPKLTREQLLFIFEKYKNRDINDINFKRDIVDTFINKIFVYDDRLVVTFNFSGENQQEISLSDLEELMAEGNSESVLLLPRQLHHTPQRRTP